MAGKVPDGLVEEYNILFHRMSLRPARRHEIDRIYKSITSEAAVSRYKLVEAGTNVPWFVVAIIHNLEASLRFDRHLHNGDRLTARTVRVPAGRPRPPLNPEFKWHDSAIDALKLKKLEEWTDWSAAGIAFVLEKYNGFGYRNRHPHVKSPYLWSFTTNYTSGKYVEDGVFSDAAVSGQCGGMALLRYMMEQDKSIAQRVKFDIEEVGEDEKTRAFPSVDGPEGSETPSIRAGGEPPPYPGRYLVRSQSITPPIDADVELVQQQLSKLRIQTGTVDGQFGADTEQGIMLFQARSANAAGEPLEVDGIVGPETWEALFGPGSVAPDDDRIVQTTSSSNLMLAVIDIASGQVGVREKPPGSNRGPQVDEFIRSVGLKPENGSFPWCMCFVHWCFQQAAAKVGVKNIVPRTGGVHLGWQGSRSLANGVRLVTAQEARANPALVTPGMVFFLDTGGGRGHVGIVTANLNSRLETIEGNTNEGGSREGIGVFRRSGRRVKDISLGFVDFTPRPT